MVILPSAIKDIHDPADPAHGIHETALLNQQLHDILQRWMNQLDAPHKALAGFREGLRKRGETAGLSARNMV
jgi:hypothetical protein